MITFAAYIGEVPEFRDIGVQDGDPTFRHDLVEQAQLGLEITRGIGVIVEMIVAEIGERRRRQVDPVDAELHEAVAGGFEDDVIGTRTRQIRQQAMEHRRLGRGVGQLDGEPLAPDPERTDGRRADTEPGPDLARERGDGCFTVGAGDGDSGGGLGPMEGGCELGEAKPRILGGDQRNGRIGEARPGRRQHRNGAPRDRIVDEVRTVHPAAGQRREQVSGLDLAAVRR